MFTTLDKLICQKEIETQKAKGIINICPFTWHLIGKKKKKMECPFLCGKIFPKINTYTQCPCDEIDEKEVKTIFNNKMRLYDV